MLPRPFSRVTLTFGSPLTFLPESADADPFESQRQSLEKTMLPGLVLV